jgi:hypothetical protein
VHQCQYFDTFKPSTVRPSPWCLNSALTIFWLLGGKRCGSVIACICYQWHYIEGHLGTYWPFVNWQHVLNNKWWCWTGLPDWWCLTGLPDFSWSQHTKTGKIYQRTTMYFTKRPQNIPNGHKIFQMVIKYTHLFHSMARQTIPIFGFLAWKNKTSGKH